MSLPNWKNVPESALPSRRNESGIWGTVKAFFSASPDYWTWTTHDGKTYEDVVPLEVVNDRIIIQHKFGSNSISKSQLTDEILTMVGRNFERIGRAASSRVSETRVHAGYSHAA